MKPAVTERASGPTVTGSAPGDVVRTRRVELGLRQADLAKHTEEQVAAIRSLEAKLGPAPDGKQREMPTDRAGANRYLRALRQVEYARSDEGMLGNLAALGIEVNLSEQVAAEVAILKAAITSSSIR